MKTDSDISRISPNVRSQLEACASLKGEQVHKSRMASSPSDFLR